VRSPSAKSPRAVVVSLTILALIARYCGFENDVHFRVQDRVAPIDGDTLKSGDTEVRLYGIDAPELYQTCTDATGKEWLAAARRKPASRR
jgi:endonuclease YncB( thermonuclease family)